MASSTSVSELPSSQILDSHFENCNPADENDITEEHLDNTKIKAVTHRRVETNKSMFRGGLLLQRPLSSGKKGLSTTIISRARAHDEPIGTRSAASNPELPPPHVNDQQIHCPTLIATLPQILVTEVDSPLNGSSHRNDTVTFVDAIAGCDYPGSTMTPPYTQHKTVQTSETNGHDKGTHKHPQNAVPSASVPHFSHNNSVNTSSLAKSLGKNCFKTLNPEAQAFHHDPPRIRDSPCTRTTDRNDTLLPHPVSVDENNKSVTSLAHANPQISHDGWTMPVNTSPRKGSVARQTEAFQISDFTCVTTNPEQNTTLSGQENLQELTAPLDQHESTHNFWSDHLPQGDLFHESGPYREATMTSSQQPHDKLPTNLRQKEHTTMHRAPDTSQVTRQLDFDKVRKQSSKAKSQFREGRNIEGQLHEKLSSTKLMGLSIRLAEQEIYDNAQEMQQIANALSAYKSKIEDLKAQVISLEDTVLVCRTAKENVTKERGRLEGELAQQSKKFQELQKFVERFYSDNQRLKQEHDETYHKLEATLMQSKHSNEVDRNTMEQSIRVLQQEMQVMKLDYEDKIRVLRADCVIATKLKDTAEQQLVDTARELSEERDKCLRLETQLKTSIEIYHKALPEFLTKTEDKMFEKLDAMQRTLPTTEYIEKSENKSQRCLEILQELHSGFSKQSSYEHFEQILAMFLERISVYIDQSQISPSGTASKANAREASLQKHFSELKLHLTNHEALLERDAMFQCSTAVLEERSSAQQKQLLEMNEERKTLRERDATFQDKLLQLQTENKMRRSSDATVEEIVVGVQVATLRNEVADLHRRLHERAEMDQSQVIIIEELKREADELRIKNTKIEIELAKNDTSKQDFEQQLLDSVRVDKEKDMKNSTQLVEEYKMNCDNEVHRARQATIQVEQKMAVKLSNLEAADAKLIWQDKKINDLHNQAEVDAKELAITRQWGEATATELRHLKQQIIDDKAKELIVKGTMEKEQERLKKESLRLQQEYQREAASSRAQIEIQQGNLRKIQEMLQQETNARIVLMAEYSNAKKNMVTLQEMVHVGKITEEQLIQESELPRHESQSQIAAFVAQRDLVELDSTQLVLVQEAQSPLVSLTDNATTLTGRTLQSNENELDSISVITMRETGANATTHEVHQPRRKANRHKGSSKESRLRVESIRETRVVIQETQVQVDGMKQYALESQTHSQTLAQSQTCDLAFESLSYAEPQLSMASTCGDSVIPETQDSLLMPTTITDMNKLIHGPQRGTDTSCSSYHSLVETAHSTESRKEGSITAISSSVGEAKMNNEVETESGRGSNNLIEDFNALSGRNEHGSLNKPSMNAANTSSARNPSTPTSNKNKNSVNELTMLSRSRSILEDGRPWIDALRVTPKPHSLHSEQPSTLNTLPSPNLKRSNLNSDLKALTPNKRAKTSEMVSKLNSSNLRTASRSSQTSASFHKILPPKRMSQPRNWKVPTSRTKSKTGPIRRNTMQETFQAELPKTQQERVRYP